MSLRPLLVLHLLLLAGCPDASEGEAPPGAVATADAVPKLEAYLEHVRVGQRYHFHVSQSGSEMDMVWTVTAVEAEQIRYDVSLLKNGEAKSPPSPTTWTVPPPPEPPEEIAEGPPKKPNPNLQVTQEFVQLAGRRWECRVTTTGDVKTWVPVHAERVSFPPLLKQTQGASVTTVLAKIEAP